MPSLRSANLNLNRQLLLLDDSPAAESGGLSSTLSLYWTFPGQIENCCPPTMASVSSLRSIESPPFVSTRNHIADAEILQSLDRLRVVFAS